MTLCILAAGMGSRYGGLKQLDPMTDAGNFIIDFSIYDAIRAGFDKVVFIIKEENLELFRETVGNRVEKKIKVEYAFQRIEDLPAGFSVPEGRTKPWGTAHALLAAKNIIKENFAVINADDFYGRDAYLQLAKHLRGAAAEQGKAHHCMVGYALGNTLTENGTVSRGECCVDAQKMLKSVTERTKIMKKDNCAAYLDDNGESWVDLPFDTIVSMNCWGFTPDVFPYLEEGFVKFLSDKDSTFVSNPLKSEFYLPASIDAQQKAGICDVKVYPTSSHWLGVTYAEDKARVKEAIKELIRAGEYPADLWN